MTANGVASARNASSHRSNPHTQHRSKPKPQKFSGLSLDSLNELELLAEQIQVPPEIERKIKRIARRDGLNSRVVLIVAAFLTINSEAAEGRGLW